MKKFFTAIPLQKQGKLDSYRYQAVGNPKLQMEEKISFPILTAINGYAQSGETIRVIAVVTDTEDGRRNLELFRAELAALCERKGLLCPKGVESVPVPADEQVKVHAATFQKLIEYVQDEDELFACMTYGTKPLSMAVMMAVQYSYRVKQNTSIDCIVYGQIDRSKGADASQWVANVFDMTALLQLDELVRLLADRGVTDPKKAIDAVLSV